MRTEIPGIRRAVEGMTWAILPGKLESMLDMLDRRAVGASAGPFVAAEPRRATRAGGGKIAVIPLFGIVCHRANMVSEASGGTSTELLGKQIAAAVDDPSITAIVLDVDSPGGATAGVPEVAKSIFALRGSKRIIAVANSLNASAAYWISSACNEIVATPSAQVGSIGVFTVRVDTSRADEGAGVKYTVIKAGKYKADGLPFEPATDEEIATTQADVDELYAMFVGTVARYRRVGPQNVRQGYGQGRVLSASRALQARMVDRIATLDDVVSGLVTGRRISRAPAAFAARQCDYCGAAGLGTDGQCAYCGAT